MTFNEWWKERLDKGAVSSNEKEIAKYAFEAGLKQHEHDYLVKTKKIRNEYEQQIEKMKCCSNCNHFNKESDIEYCQNCERQLVNSLDNFPREEIIKDEWELRR